MIIKALSRMANTFLPSILMQGQAHQQKKHVLNIRVSEGLLKARVKGNSGQIYDVHLDLKQWPEKPAQCTCPAKMNCEHAAASLFALQTKENQYEKSLNTWLSSLHAKEVEKLQEDNSYEINYLLERQLSGYEHRIVIRLALTKRLKRGGLGKKRIINSITAGKRQYFTSEDEFIISALLEKCGIEGSFDRFTIRNSDLLEKLLTTGRAFEFGAEEINLKWGQSLTADLSWQLDITGQQHLKFFVQGSAIQPLVLDNLLYFDPINYEIGILKTAYNRMAVKNVLAMDVVNLEQAAALAEKMAESDSELPRPKVFAQQQKQLIKPQPVAVFDIIELNHDSASPQEPPIEATQLAPFAQDIFLAEGNPILLIVKLFFDYAGLRVLQQATHMTLMREQHGNLICIQRALMEESQKQNELEQLLALRAPNISDKLHVGKRLQDAMILTQFNHTDDLPHFYNQIIPLLKSKGWVIEFTQSIYEELLDSEKLEWFSELKEQGHNFFSYQLGIIVDGKPVSIVPLVAELISRFDRTRIESLSDKEQLRLRLPEGKAIQVSWGRIKPLVRLLLQYGMRQIKQAESLTVTRYQLVLLQETEKAIKAIAARWQGHERLKQQLEQLVTMHNLPNIAVPKGLKAQLRDYQHQGLNWLQFLRAAGFAGVLADDMGLGKTIQTLAHLQVEQEAGRLTKASLIIAPTSLVGNWYEEAKRFTPKLKVLIFHGAERRANGFDDYDLIISTYGLIQRDKSCFTAYPFYYLILDEAQFIKNARTKTTQIIQQISAEHRLCLSGTPLENHLGELWSLFHFLMPGLLGDAKQFRQFFKTPIEKLADEEKRVLLAKRVRPFMLRRTKNQVAWELPDKTETTLHIELAGEQRDLYEAIRMTMEKKVREAIAKQGIQRSHIILLDALLRLRQVCCDPRLLTIPEAEMAYGSSAKLIALMELLNNLIDEGRRVLVFSQFATMLKLIEEQLAQKGYEYLKLTGQTQNRLELVNTFQMGKVPIFLISLKAGGTGLNLTRADTVIHYDPWWNPAVEDQATDRSHRIGQENPVFVYKLITKGTVEEAILAMQEKKRQLFTGILSENVTGMAGLTKQDIEQFFVPLS